MAKYKPGNVLAIENYSYSQKPCYLVLEEPTETTGNYSLLELALRPSKENEGLWEMVRLVNKTTTVIDDCYHNVHTVELKEPLNLATVVLDNPVLAQYVNVRPFD